MQTFEFSLDDCSVTQTSASLSEEMLICSNSFLRNYALLYSFFYSIVLRVLIVMMLVPAIWYFLRDLFLIWKGEVGNTGRLYVLLILTAVYYPIAMIFTYDGNYVRMMAPLTFIGIVLVSMVIDYFIADVMRYYTIFKPQETQRSLSSPPIIGA
jgi:hypothetical protein